MKIPATFRALSSDPREAVRIVLEPSEAVVWEGLAVRRDVPLVAPWVVRAAVWGAVALVVLLTLAVSQRWWGGAIAAVVLVPVAIKLRRLQARPRPFARPYFAVSDRRLVLVEPRGFFGVEPGVTSYRAENLPPGGTLKEHRRGNDLCLRHWPSEGGEFWSGLRSVPDADRVEELLAELKGRG